MAREAQKRNARNKPELAMRGPRSPEEQEAREAHECDNNQEPQEGQECSDKPVIDVDKLRIGMENLTTTHIHTNEDIQRVLKEACVSQRDAEELHEKAWQLEERAVHKDTETLVQLDRARDYYVDWLADRSDAHTGLEVEEQVGIDEASDGFDGFEEDQDNGDDVEDNWNLEDWDEQDDWDNYEDDNDCDDYDDYDDCDNYDDSDSD